MLHITSCPSPFGTFEIKGSELGIRSVQLSEEPVQATKAPLPQPLKDCVIQLKEYFARKRKDFDLLLDWSGAPEFHQQVWGELVKIPYGHTFTYSGIADRLGDANKMRAVGQANRNNPIAIIVPCHRIIAKNGDLQGYFYGLNMKRKLLELENPMSFASQGSLF